MFTDASLYLSGSATTAQAITTTADSTNVYDITGAGSGNAPAMIGGYPATNTSIGVDMGSGDGLAIPYVYVAITVTGTTSNTLTISLSAAPDNGSYSPGTYTQLYASKAIVASTLTAGDYLMFQIPPYLGAEESEALPRFYKLTYTASSSLTVSLRAFIVINPPYALLSGAYSSNFVAV